MPELQKEVVENLIANALIDQAFAYISTCVESFSDARHNIDFTMLSSRWKYIEKKRRRGTISFTEHTLEINKIKDSLLELVYEIDGMADSLNTQFEQDRVYRIKFDKRKPTELDCFCCNREQQFQNAMHFLDTKKNWDQLHLFITSFHHDAPESFVTRLLKKHLGNNFNESTRKVEHLHTERVIDRKIDRPSIAITIIEADINKHKGPSFPEYIALFYKIELKSWEIKDCVEYLEYVSSGKLITLPNKKIRIFYWLDITGCNSEPSILKRIFARKIDVLSERIGLIKKHTHNNDLFFVIENLPKIRASDLTSWFSDFCFNSESYQDFINSIFSSSKDLHMAKIEQHLLEQYRLNNQYRITK